MPSAPRGDALGDGRAWPERAARLSLAAHQRLERLCYAARRVTIEGLRERMLALARERPRWGYRRLHVVLRREGYEVNHKRVHVSIAAKD